VAAGSVVAFVLAVGDVEITQLLCPPGSGTLAMRLFTFLHFGPTHVAAGLSLLLLALATAPVIVYFLLTDRYLHII
jgi:ABC-type spermidine/putrescine transport system permease subunit II